MKYYIVTPLLAAVGITFTQELSKVSNQAKKHNQIEYEESCRAQHAEKYFYEKLKPLAPTHLQQNFEQKIISLNESLKRKCTPPPKDER